MLIVAGTYYDAERYSRLVVVGPGWRELGYKIRPSRYEVSPVADEGMRPGPELLLIETPYGRIAPITCVDLISDTVQYQMRNLANRNLIDVLININYNPASWEFMIEANSIARRHPIFVSITNVAVWPPRAAECAGQDDGSCGGNSALFGSLRMNPKDCPNCAETIVKQLAPSFVDGGKRATPFDTLVAAVPPTKEVLLVYDLNLRLLREPAATNAPDEGYPPVRNLRQVPIP